MSRYNFFTWCKYYIRLPFVLGIGVILFITFFNENNIVRYYEYDNEIERLHREIRDNEDSIAYYHDLNNRLSTDKATLERIVREQYHMQRINEDVYIFEKE